MTCATICYRFMSRLLVCVCTICFVYFIYIYFGDILHPLLCALGGANHFFMLDCFWWPSFGSFYLLKFCLWCTYFQQYLVPIFRSWIRRVIFGVYFCVVLSSWVADSILNLDYILASSCFMLAIFFMAVFFLSTPHWPVSYW